MTPELLRLTRTYQAQLTRTGLRTGAAASRALLAMTPLDDASAAAWRDLVRPLVDAGRATGAGLTDAYHAAYADALGVRYVELAEPFDLSIYRNGVTVDEVLMRSIIKARTVISQGKSFEEAMQAAAKAAAARAETDVTLAERDRSSQIFKANRIVGYRRVPDASACDFCLLVSTRRYKTSELRSIHTKCHCTSAPIYGSKDPGIVANPELLKQIKGKSVKTVETELGPSITPD